jgi:hypothetical protein
MHPHTELSFVDEFRWVSPLHYLKNVWQNTVLRWCMLRAGPPSLHYYCAVLLHSCILLTPVSHSSNHEYHCCQLTRQSSCVSNFYHTFKVFIWLSLIGTVHLVSLMLIFTSLKIIFQKNFKKIGFESPGTLNPNYADVIHTYLCVIIYLIFEMTKWGWY